MSVSMEIYNKNIKRNNKYNDVVNLLVYGSLNETRDVNKKNI